MCGLLEVASPKRQTSCPVPAPRSSKPAPRTSTRVPPAKGPEAGESEETDGAACTPGES